MQIPNDLGRSNRTQLEGWCRQAHAAVNVGGSRILCRVLGKYLMQVDGRDISVAPHLALNGYWESWVTQFLSRTVQPGWTCVDVGANVGYFTLLLADLVGSSGTVVALEPQTRVYELLRLNQELNGFSNIRAVQTAAGAEHGNVVLQLPFSLWGGAHVSAVETEPRSTIETTEVVVSEPLTSVVYEGVPDFIKIDAEGAEPAIWQGMGPWLAQVRKQLPRLLIEWAPGRYDDPGAFLTEIESAGYKLALVDGSGFAVSTSRDHLLGIEDLDMLWLDRDPA